MKLASVKVLYIMSIHTDGASVYIIETHQKLNHSGLSCACRSYNGNFLSVLYLCGKIMDNNLIRIISETYMIKFHISIKTFYRYCVFFYGFFLFLIQELKHTLGGCC